MEDRLIRKVEDFEFSIRTENALKFAGIYTQDDLTARTFSELSEIRNLGCKGREEVLQKLQLCGLTLKKEEKEVCSEKYIYYIKNYVGRNCATFGYAFKGENYHDTYGEREIKIILVSLTGTYVDVSSIDSLKEWVVVAQNIPPNTEFKYSFIKTQEYDPDNWEEFEVKQVYWQNYDEIVLVVKPVEEFYALSLLVTEIKPSPDKYTAYIYDYVGRNLATCGYVALNRGYYSKYGAAARIKLIIFTEDGSYIDPRKKESFAQYVVTGQSVAPNTELKLAFRVDSNGDETNHCYDQSIQEIELRVRRLQTRKCN